MNREAFRWTAVQRNASEKRSNVMGVEAAFGATDDDSAVLGHGSRIALLSGWTSLETAYAISDDGSTIVGEGFHDGVREGWIATLPEPSSSLLAGVAMIALARMRKRR
jgi:hypothetical protein